MRISVTAATPAAPSVLPEDEDLLRIEISSRRREIDCFATQLSRVLPYDQADDLSERLMVRFGSLAEIWTVPHAELRRLGVPGEAIADFVRSIEFWQELQWSKLRNRVLMQSWSDVREYLRVTMRNLQDKQFRVLFLDGQMQMKFDEVLFRGYENDVRIYTREVGRRCLELKAASIVTIRNLPDRDATLTARDALDDVGLAEALAGVGVSVSHRVVVAGDAVQLLSSPAASKRTQGPTMRSLTT